MRKRVLFLCTGNSCRSQLAEGLLRHYADTQFDVFSAGTKPVGIHSKAVQVMREMGLNLASHRSKHVDEFTDQHFDYVITVCDNARESCPFFPGGGQRLHWPFEDPAHASGNDEEVLSVFRRVRDEIAERIQRFVETERS
jgi:arsenate reductase